MDKIEKLLKTIEGHNFGYITSDGYSYCRHPDHYGGYSRTCWRAEVVRFLKEA